MFDLRLEKLQNQNTAPWSERIISQLEYARELSNLAGGKHDSIIEDTIAFLVRKNEDSGNLTKTAAMEAEKMITSLSAEAKKYKIICAAHAHIDMNWMWRWDETVAITLDTFRTMLDLMDEYPGYTFSQSQASVYQIVETHAPEMLAEIRKRVEEGRWEVTASTWVEGDKNMPNGESQVRHLLYTRQYLSELLGLGKDDFSLDFEPDTFGHHANVPDILASGGVKYYYHCRGDEHHLLYRWVAPSGRSIIVYREPTWYLGFIDPRMAIAAPSFCHKHGFKSMLKVYGVGDHGGGPTRRDLNRILHMNTWPVFPKIHFGTFADFYQQVEQVKDQLPEISGEQNFVFSGCYTTQSRIKQGNRLSENVLFSAETFNTWSALKGQSYPTEKYTTGWVNTLFNQFHDIITGSGVADTREYARGLFQQTLGIANSSKRLTFQSLTQPGNADIEDALPISISEGAGVGFGVEEFSLSQVSRGGGIRRLFHLFNPSPWEREELVELVLWDWEGDLKRMVITDEDDRSLEYQFIYDAWKDYWGHKYIRLLVNAALPPCGYATVVLNESGKILDFKAHSLGPRIEEPEKLVLENEYLRAEFDRSSCALVSLRSKASDSELIDQTRPATFRHILEDDRKGMTAWIVGRYLKIEPLVENVRLLKLETNNSLRQSLVYEVRFSRSKLNVTVSLDTGSRRLDYDASCEWLEVGRPGEGVPQLNFHLPLAHSVDQYRYDIPFGTVDRDPFDQDVPANSWGMGLVENDEQVQLITESTYGFRGFDNSLALDLLRSSFDPDPHPELGIHALRFALVVVDQDAGKQELIANAFDFSHPVDVISGKGSQPIRESFLTLEKGSVIISAVKMAEGIGSKDVIIRLYETEGQETEVALRFAYPVLSADWVDTHEEKVALEQTLQSKDYVLSMVLKPYQMAAVRLKFT